MIHYYDLEYEGEDPNKRDPYLLRSMESETPIFVGNPVKFINHGALGRYEVVGKRRGSDSRLVLKLAAIQDTAVPTFGYRFHLDPEVGLWQEE